MPRIEPRVAGWEASLLPLCYAAPLDLNFFLFCGLLLKYNWWFRKSSGQPQILELTKSSMMPLQRDNLDSFEFSLSYLLHLFASQQFDSRMKALQHKCTDVTTIAAAAAVVTHNWDDSIWTKFQSFWEPSFCKMKLIMMAINTLIKKIPIVQIIEICR